ncbi:MAG: IS110 family transposase [Bacteroidota bacterium]
MSSINLRNRFEGTSIYVGIDVHLKSWKVSIFSQEFELKTFTQCPDSKVLMDFLRDHYPGANYHCVYEAGFSGFSTQRVLTGLGAKCSVIHPADVPTSDKEKKRKSDRVDSRKLGRGLKNGDLQPIYIPDSIIEQDRALLRTRDRIVRNKTRVKNRIKFFLMFFGKAVDDDFKGKVWSKKFIDWLTNLQLGGSANHALQAYLSELGHLESLEKQLNGHIKRLSRSGRYAKKVKLLMGIPSIGLTSAMILLTEIGDINRFKSLKSLCSYFGLVPNSSSSGESSYIGRMTRRGNSYLKFILIECAWTAMRKDLALLLTYKSAIVHTEPNKAIIKVARKLLNRIRYVLKNEQEYVIGVTQ